MAGRPRKELNEKQIEILASLQCTMKEIAAVMECSVDTLERNYADTIKNGQDKGRMSLRRHQFKLAEKSAAMSIWLGKQYLGQTEKIEQTVTEKLSMEEAQEYLADIFQIGTTN